MRKLCDVPSTGWKHVDVLDLGAGEYESCDRCGTRIRYVHTLRHSASADIHVGSECAVKLGQVKETLKQREADAATWKKDRDSWLNRAWFRSKKGNPTLRVDHRTVTVYPSSQMPGAFEFIVFNGDKKLISGEAFDSIGEAKMAAYDNLFPR